MHVEIEDASSGRIQQRKKSTVRSLTTNIFLAVLQHVLALQSDIQLFLNAFGGDQAATSRTLATATGVSSVLGLLLNQIGGKLSDVVGRKPCLLTGPVMNMLTSAAVISFHRSVPVLVAARILKSIFITFSGTVISGASLSDILAPDERAKVGPNILAAVGCAVILGPFMEGWILKKGRGDLRGAYMAMSLVSVIQVSNAALFFKETLATKVRKPLSEAFRSITELNPFNFVFAFWRSRNLTFKKLMLIQFFQQCSDGKVTSDLCQMWTRNYLKWSDSEIRNFIAFWGATVTLASAVVHPALIQKMKAFNYATLGNLSIWFGLSFHGLLANRIGLWGGVPLLIPGVNGGAAHSISALSIAYGKEEGYGNGEMSAWMTNGRTLMQALVTMLLGNWYGRCTERGAFPGTAWWIAGFIAGGIPQLIMMSMGPASFEPPPEKKKIETDTKTTPKQA
jgi:MFS family permease